MFSRLTERQLIWNILAEMDCMECMDVICNSWQTWFTSPPHLATHMPISLTKSNPDIVYFTLVEIYIILL